MEKIYRVQMNAKGMPNFSTAVEVADRPQGEWIRERWTNEHLVGVECSNCHIVESRFSPFCPNCGADMRGESDDR